MRILVDQADVAPFAVEVEETANVWELKHVIYREAGLLPTQQNLIFRGVILDGDALLTECGLQNDAHVFMMSINEGESGGVNDDAYIEVVKATPEIQDLLKRHPTFISEPEIADYLREGCEMRRSASAMSEMGRLVDLAMTKMEREPSHLSEYIRNSEDVAENDVEDILAGRVNLSVEEEETIITSKSKGPSCDPLPMADWLEEEVFMEDNTDVREDVRESDNVCSRCMDDDCVHRRNKCPCSRRYTWGRYESDVDD